jgi:hypothetical protein
MMSAGRMRSIPDGRGLAKAKFRLDAVRGGI